MRKSNNFLESTSFRKRGERAILLNGLKPFHRNIHDNGLFELGHIDTPLLEIRLTADFAGGIKLRRTGAIGIPPADLRALSSYVANAYHN